MVFKRIAKIFFDHQKRLLFPFRVSGLNPLNNLKITNTEHVRCPGGLPNLIHSIKPVVEEPSYKFKSSWVIQQFQEELKKKSEKKSNHTEATFLSNCNSNVNQDSLGISILDNGIKKRAGNWVNKEPRASIRTFSSGDFHSRDTFDSVQFMVHFRSLLDELKVVLDPLPYAYDELEPTIARQVLEIHYRKIHNTYVINYNKGLDKIYDLALKVDFPQMLETAQEVKSNLLAHMNHSMFWGQLTPHSTKPSNELNRAIVESFGSLTGLKKQLSCAADFIEGDGWVWLVFDSFPRKGKIVIRTTEKEDCIITSGLIPLLAIDVWEHAYYFQYKNDRAQYVNAIFDIINWDKISELFAFYQEYIIPDAINE